MLSHFYHTVLRILIGRSLAYELCNLAQKTVVVQGSRDMTGLFKLFLMQTVQQLATFQSFYYVK